MAHSNTHKYYEPNEQEIIGDTMAEVFVGTAILSLCIMFLLGVLFGKCSKKRLVEVEVIKSRRGKK